MEKDKIGGTCLNRGCMPTKALLHSAEVYHEATHSEDIGILGRDVAIDWAKVQSNRQSVSDRLTGGVRALMRANKITVVDGDAVFTGPKTVKVGDKALTADKIIIAVGSYPIIPGIPGVKESEACIDSTGALTLDHIPESLLVIGGGVIGIELGSAYQRFGTKVTVVEMLPKLLPLMDAELTAMVQAQLEAAGMEILTSSTVLSVKDVASGAEVKVKTPSGERAISAEKVLVCVGRGPNTANLGLEKAGIKAEKGYIQVNDRMETNVPGVYAVGDCNGKLMLAHTAYREAEVAVNHMLGIKDEMRYEVVPSVIYTDPEVASVGESKASAEAKGMNVKEIKVPMVYSGRYVAENEGGKGFIKLVVDTDRNRLVGCHMVGSYASECIMTATMMVDTELTPQRLQKLVFPHPTVSEIIREALFKI